MKRTLIPSLGLICLVIFLLTGCSTLTSIATTTTAAPASTTTTLFPYTGTWGGSWQDIASGQHGALAVIVSNNGTFAGLITNNYVGTGEVAGAITASGVASLTFTYSPQYIYLATGALALVGNHAIGVLDEYYGLSKFGTAEVDLTKLF